MEVQELIFAVHPGMTDHLRTGKWHNNMNNNVFRIRKYIPQDTSVVLVKSLVMSRLDYSNGLFYGLHKCTVSGL